MPPYVANFSDDGPNNDSASLSRANFDYDYPGGLKLKPGSDFHDKLRDRIYQRANASMRAIKPRHESWKQIDSMLTAYIPPDEDIKKIRCEDPNAPLPIVVPVSYSVKDTLLTYAAASFLDAPYFRYSPVGPEDVVGAALLEKVIDQQCGRSGVGLSIHTLLDNAISYGLSVASPTWYRRQVWRTASEHIPMPGTNQIMQRRGRREEILEGNQLENINPYLFLPDPTVAIQNVQKGEFVGWIQQTNRMTLLSDEAMSDGTLFNAKYLKPLGQARSTLVKSQGGASADRLAIIENKRTMDETLMHVDVIRMYVNLIPDEWDLGPSTKPEKWLFALAGDQIILQAQPVGLNHGLFPVVTCAPNFDGHSIAPLSPLEVVFGAQEIANFLCNSHIHNLRTGVNIKLVFNPQIIDPEDLAKSKGGSAIPIRDTFWNDPDALKKAIFQIPIQDVTAHNMADLAQVMDIIFKATGATDVLQGVPMRKSDRVSATEAGNTKSSALSRVGRMIQVIGLQAMQPIGHFFASHAQQMMSQETAVKIIGRYEADLKAEYGNDAMFAQVSPFDLIDANFDVMDDDATTAAEQNVAMLMQWLQIGMANPLIAAREDLPRLWEHVGTLAGFKNLPDFHAATQSGMNIQPQVMQDSNVIDMAQRGNLQPLPSGGVQ